MKKAYNYIASLALVFALTSCEKALEVAPRSEFSPGNVLTTESGIKALLFSAYAQAQTQTNSRYVINDSEVSTDMGFNTGGAENGQLIQIINFTWDPTLGTFNDDMWAPNYRTIRDANGVVENIDKVTAADAVKKLYKAEARVLRAHAYALLYSFFGPVPLRTSTTQPSELARASDAEMLAFIEKEITESLADLPDPGKEEAYGRLNKGVANSMLAKFFPEYKAVAESRQFG